MTSLGALFTHPTCFGWSLDFEEKVVSTISWLHHSQNEVNQARDYVPKGNLQERLLEG